MVIAAFDQPVGPIRQSKTQSDQAVRCDIGATLPIRSVASEPISDGIHRTIQFSISAEGLQPIASLCVSQTPGFSGQWTVKVVPDSAVLVKETSPLRYRSVSSLML